MTKPRKIAGDPVVHATDLALGNAAFRAADFPLAISLYMNAIRRAPALGEILGANLAMAHRKMRNASAVSPGLRVAVCGWDLAHNAAGRVYTLAQLYQPFAEVEIVGSIFPAFGRELWEPIRDTKIPYRYFVVDSPAEFVTQAIDLVQALPYDIVHLSKPRAPNIIFGILYRLIWNSKVIVDVDDEELGFVGARGHLDIDAYLAQYQHLPGLEELTGADWTRLAVGLSAQFDGLTVSNAALQRRYGGSVIPHARDERRCAPSVELTRASRKKYGIPIDKQVVLFFGTPRAHKGLLETARSLSAMNRSDVVFAIVGNFDDPKLKEKLLALPGVDYRFIGSQPFDAIPEVVAIGDYCILLQNPNSAVARFQAPAKVSDALAMGLVVLAGRVEPMKDLFDAEACIDAAFSDIQSKLKRFLDDPVAKAAQQTKARNFFLNNLSSSVVSKKLRRYISEIAGRTTPMSVALDRLVRSRVFPEWFSHVRDSWQPSPLSRVMVQRDAAAAPTSPAPWALLAGDASVKAFDAVFDRITAGNRSSELADAMLRTADRIRTVPKSIANCPRRPLISVIMPTFNRAGSIGPSVRSVMQQSYLNWELLVCDDASTDDTSTVIAEMGDARIRYLKLIKGGAAAARNAGLQQAKGEIIAYLDSDNYWHPEYLAAMWTALDNEPGKSAVYCDFLDFHVDRAGRFTINSFARPGFSHESLLERPFIDLNSFVHRRELYDCFGGFNPSLRRRQDYDLILKYTWLRDPIHLPCVLTLYQRNDTLAQITRIERNDRSCITIVDQAVQSYFSHGLPVNKKAAVKSVTIISWDLCRNHFSKPFALAEALSKQFDVQLISFRFFSEKIFPPLQGVKPAFETVYLPGGAFPKFFTSMTTALEKIRGDLIYVVKPRLPSLGLALLANAKRGTPIILEINDLETVVGSPDSSDVHVEADLEKIDLFRPELRNPYHELWSQVLDPIAKQLPTLVTHNKNIDEHFGRRCLYMRNIKDERVYDSDAYDREKIRSELGFNPGDRVILFGGLLRKHKGIYELVELLRRLDDPRYKLLFVGSRATPDQTQLVAEYGDVVKVLPPQDRTAMARINLAADLVILWLNPDVPASHYQFPYKATDALAMGTAIIANDISDLGDLAHQGYLREVAFGDWDAMTDAIQSLFSVDGDREGIREAGKRLFLRQFSYAAARGAFALAAERALADGGSKLPVARRFALRYAQFQEAVGSITSVARHDISTTETRTTS